MCAAWPWTTSASRQGISAGWPMSGLSQTSSTRPWGQVRDLWLYCFIREIFEFSRSQRHDSIIPPFVHKASDDVEHSVKLLTLWNRFTVPQSPQCHRQWEAYARGPEVGVPPPPGDDCTHRGGRGEWQDCHTGAAFNIAVKRHINCMKTHNATYFWIITANITIGY